MLFERSYSATEGVVISVLIRCLGFLDIYLWHTLGSVPQLCYGSTDVIPVRKPAFWLGGLFDLG